MSVVSSQPSLGSLEYLEVAFKALLDRNGNDVHTEITQCQRRIEDFLKTKGEKNWLLTVGRRFRFMISRLVTNLFKLLPLLSYILRTRLVMS